VRAACVLALAFLAQCAGSGDAEPEVAAPRVVGRIVVEGAPPTPRRRELDPEMSAVAGQDELVDEAWLLGPQGGLANCVVLLEPLDEDLARPPGAPTTALYERSARATSRAS